MLAYYIFLGASSRTWLLNYFSQFSDFCSTAPYYSFGFEIQVCHSSWAVALCYVVLFYDVCYVMLCCVMLCSVVLWCVWNSVRCDLLCAYWCVFCYMLCCAVLCCVVLCVRCCVHVVQWASIVICDGTSRKM